MEGHIKVDEHRFRGLCLATFAGRLRGWLARAPSAEVQAVVLVPCRRVHFWGVHFPLEVLFVTADGRVLTHGIAAPGARPRGHAAAWAVVEIAACYVPPGFAPERVQWMP